MPLMYTTLPNGLTIAHMNTGESKMLYREIFTDRCYMQHNVTIRPGDVIFDVGANIGLAALFFHAECADIQVYAFEPAPIPYAALVENLNMHEINGITRRVAIGSSTGESSFTYYPETTVMSGLDGDTQADTKLSRTFLKNSGIQHDKDLDFMLEGKFEPKKINVEVTTLSEMIKSYQVPSVDLLKIDVERSELKVLQGLTDDDWPKVKQIVAEVHDISGGLLKFNEVLQDRGFNVAVTQDPFLRDTEVWEVFAVRSPTAGS